MTRTVCIALLGFLAGAASLVGGRGGNEGLVARLAELREAAAAAMAAERPADGESAAVEEDPPLALFPVQDLVGPRRDFPPPGEDGNEPAPEWAGAPLGSLEELMELLLVTVWPQDSEEGFLHASGQTLLASQTRGKLADVDRFLEQTLRSRANLTVAMEGEVVEVPSALARTLAAESGVSLRPESRSALQEAIKSGEARRLFAARVSGLAGQRVLVWQGREAAFVGDFDMEVAEKSAAADPVVAVVVSGGYLSIRPSVGEDPSTVTLDLEFRLDGIEPRFRVVETEVGGGIEVPVLLRRGCRTTVTARERAWTVVGEGAAEADRRVLFLVRATLLPRKGGGR